jgi:hypothetical protein
MDTSLLDELIQKCDKEPLSDTAIAHFLAEMSREQFCDAFSHRIAHEYAAERMSFDTADAAMNRLLEFAFLGDDVFIPPYSREVFEAFDEGEYLHHNDPPGTDSEQKYTRPWVLEIVARG